MDSFVEFMKVKNDWRVVSKDVWGGAPPRATEPLQHPVSYVRVTYTMTDPCRKKATCSNILQDLQGHHMNELNLPDIECNFMVGVDGSVYVGRGWYADAYIQGVHHPRLKGNCIHIGYIGYYKVLKPPGNAEQSTWQLINYGMKNNLIKQRSTVSYFKSTDSVWWNNVRDVM
ncbi:peptidoglycan-recognition protein 3-like [Macrosteles quadrilineatus]|uniref:peptidoglycan-recognition protein 3-like n=1 Tax=Macrosteles quadrilineatus TaxID=74068 RepID=UPI0023E19DA7|nr:peptidoglycan-recognition protein 3-like [Macrosteles quadrilineatus]